jgi:phosphatidylethanolamine-binding protein
MVKYYSFSLIVQSPSPKVRYSKNVTVQLGNILTPTQVKKEPVLRWRALPDTFYTLIMTDPDPTPDVREWVHWIVGNIPGNFVAQGEIISAYVGSAPPKDSGMHRYVLLLYRQNNKTVFDEKRLGNT